MTDKEYVLSKYPKAYIMKKRNRSYYLYTDKSKTELLAISLWTEQGVWAISAQIIRDKENEKL